jgi:ribosome modulation factor
MTQQGLEGVVERPQPRFGLIKRHYRHGITGKSRNGCPLEIECMGGWRAAYDAMRKEGAWIYYDSFDWRGNDS